MTERELYEFALIEMNKVEAPSLLLEDYNYFINKAVQQYINKVYNRYDINQQSTDDLRVLKATAEVKLEHKPLERLEENDPSKSKRRVAGKDKFVYWGILPKDYMHILNCVVDYKVNHDFKCYRKDDYIEFAAKRLTADMAAGILHNVYMKPDYKRPYFYINNVNTKIAADIHNADTEETLNTFDSTNPDIDDTIIVSADKNYIKDRESKNRDGNRTANVSEVRIEIRFGDDDTVFTPEYAYIDYIKAPMFIQLTYEDITSTEDHTRVLEFPDYVCFEIVNEFVKLLMENASDPRLQTNYAINQTIGDPTVSKTQSQSKDKS